MGFISTVLFVVGLCRRSSKLLIASGLFALAAVLSNVLL